MHYVSLVKVQKLTPRNSLDKAADLFYWIILGAIYITQRLVLATSTLGIVLPLEKMLASGVTVSDYYKLFASDVHILHLCTLNLQNVYSTTKELLVKAKIVGRMCNGLCNVVQPRLSELAGTRQKSVWTIKSSNNWGCLLTHAYTQELRQSVRIIEYADNQGFTVRARANKAFQCFSHLITRNKIHNTSLHMGMLQIVRNHSNSYCSYCML